MNTRNSYGGGNYRRKEMNILWKFAFMRRGKSTKVLGKITFYKRNQSTIYSTHEVVLCDNCYYALNLQETRTLFMDLVCNICKQSRDGDRVMIAKGEGQGLRAVPWEEESRGTATVAVDLDGGNGAICISQAMHRGRGTHGPS